MRLALALSLALVGWASGCSRERDEAPVEQHAIAAELLVAPVVDDHPWVIALLTEISITRPPGTDARLEGRQGPEGLRHPEPIIEAEDRESLERALAAYEAKHPRSPELLPVWEFEPFGPGERVAWRLFFVDRSRGFVVDDQARASLVHHVHGPRVHVVFGEAQREMFLALTTEMVGGRVAIVVDGGFVNIPIVNEPVPIGDIQLHTGARKDHEAAASALLDRLRG